MTYEALPDGHFRLCPLSQRANPVGHRQVHCDAGDDVFVLAYLKPLLESSKVVPYLAQKHKELAAEFLIDT